MSSCLCVQKREEITNMKFLIAAVAVLLAVTSQHLLVDARATRRSLLDDIENDFDDAVDELFGDGESS